MRQKLGQHFLLDPEVPEIMAAALKPAASDTIIEVGPGHGELTQAIVTAIESGKVENIKVVAVERDPLLAEEVRQRFKEYNFLEVVEEDILEFLKGPAAEALTKSGYKLAGNIPYYITGHLLRIVGEREILPDLAALMLQKEVAERIAARPPRMNRLAAAVQFWAEPQLLVKVGKDKFDPPPEVDSAVILLSSRQAKKGQDSAIFYETVRALFAQPRKTVFNNLRQAFAARKLPADKAAQLLKEANIDIAARPQDLSLEKIADLANRMPNN